MRTSQLRGLAAASAAKEIIEDASDEDVNDLSQKVATL